MKTYIRNGITVNVFEGFDANPCPDKHERGVRLTAVVED